jgi:hypothetical protein
LVSLGNVPGMPIAGHVGAVRLPGKEVVVKRARLIGGIVLLALAALIFLFLETSASIPVAITLTVVGVALVATARRKKSQ